MLGQRRDGSRYREGPGSTDIPKTLPSDQRLDPNLVAVRGLALSENGAGDGNRTHGSSLGSLGITIIRRPLQLDCNHVPGGPANRASAMAPVVGHEEPIC